VKTKGDTIDVNNGLQFSVSAADNLGLKSLSISLTGGYTGQIDSRSDRPYQQTLPRPHQLPKNTSAGGKVLIKVTATDGKLELVRRPGLDRTDQQGTRYRYPVRPLTGAVTSAGKQVLVQVNAHQNKGITRSAGFRQGPCQRFGFRDFRPPLDTTSGRSDVHRHGLRCRRVPRRGYSP